MLEEIAGVYEGDVFSSFLLTLFIETTKVPRGASQVALVVKNPPANVGDVRDAGSIPGSGRCSGGGPGTPLQYSCLEKPHGQRSLAGCSPWGGKEWDMTEATLPHPPSHTQGS